MSRSSQAPWVVRVAFAAALLQCALPSTRAAAVDVFSRHMIDEYAIRVTLPDGYAWRTSDFQWGVAPALLAEWLSPDQQIGGNIYHHELALPADAYAATYEGWFRTDTAVARTLEVVDERWAGAASPVLVRHYRETHDGTPGDLLCAYWNIGPDDFALCTWCADGLWEGRQREMYTVLGSLEQGDPAWTLDALSTDTSALDPAGLARVREAAEAGDARSQFMVGLAHEFGVAGAPKDDAEALRWHLEAAEQGIGLSEAWVGDFYFYGMGVPKDYRTAATWYRRSVDHEYPYAAGMLGDMSLFGLGRREDMADAALWYQRAVDMGDDELRPARDATSSDCRTKFCASLARLVAASRDDFDLIRGEEDGDVTLSMAGARYCTLATNEDTGAVNYYCDFGDHQGAAADRQFYKLVNQVRYWFLPAGWTTATDAGDGYHEFVAGPPTRPRLISVSSMQGYDVKGRPARMIGFYVE